jgi:hypothetical protein
MADGNVRLEWLRLNARIVVHRRLNGRFTTADILRRQPGFIAITASSYGFERAVRTFMHTLRSGHETPAVPSPCLTRVFRWRPSKVHSCLSGYLNVATLM